MYSSVTSESEINYLKRTPSTRDGPSGPLLGEESNPRVSQGLELNESLIEDVHSVQIMINNG